MIVNNSNFTIEVEQYHPLTQKYQRISYWGEQTKRCIEGYWSSGKWMPGPLYFYVNFFTIKKENKKSGGMVFGRPDLSDIEWDKAYNYEEACGFSGFADDKEYTCDRRYGPEKERALQLQRITEDDLNKFKYINAREYLRKNHGRDLGRPLYENSSKNIIDLESRGGGKEQPHSEKVATPNGFVTMGSINVGDVVIGANGLRTNVLKVFPQGAKDIYKVTLNDGRSVRCGLEHQWEVFDGRNKRILTTEKLIDLGYKYKHKKNGGDTFRFKIRNCEPVEYEEKKLDIDPYIFGYLLGSGKMTTKIPKIASSDKFILDEFKRILGDNFTSKYDKSTSNSNTISYNGDDEYGINNKYGYNKIITQIKKLGINKKCSDKFIPDIYKLGSVNQRLSLIQGLLDANGSINVNGTIKFTNTNEKLLDDLIEVARSLGIQCRKCIDNRSTKTHSIKGCECDRSITYNAYLRTGINVFRLPRKRDRIKPMKRNNWVSITDIKKLDYQEECSCIMVNNCDYTYLTSDYVVTHNSYLAAGFITHNFIFDGATSYSSYLFQLKIKQPLNSASVVGAEEAKFTNDLLSKVKDGIEYLPGSLEVGGRIFPSPFAPLTEGSLMPAKNFKSTTTGSVIHHRIFGEDPLSANGTRPNRAWLEEVGFLSSITQTWGALEATQQSFEKKTLVIYALGTGGMMKGGAALYAREVFYNPNDYNCLVFEDIWENKGDIGYFLPATHTLREFKKGPNRITDEKLALSYIEGNREEAKKANSSLRYLTEVINAPLKPSEIFMSIEGNFFPVADLRAVLSDIEVKQSTLDASWKVDLEMIKEGYVEAKPSNKKPIREFPLTKNSAMDACIELFERPKRDNNNLVPFGRYWQVVDPVDDDGNSDVKRSLQSCMIYDSWTDRIVAEYTARTYLAEEFYENVRRLSMYYNTEILYENNKKGMYAYFKNKNSLHRLLPTPEILKEQQLVKIEALNNKSLGVNMSNDKLKLFALNKYKSWLEKGAYDDPGVKNLQKLKSVGLLKETIMYSPGVNVDRVSAMLVLMILIADRGDKSIKDKNASIKSASSSSFWNNAYGAKSKVYNPLLLGNQ